MSPNDYNGDAGDSQPLNQAGPAPKVTFSQSGDIGLESNCADGHASFTSGHAPSKSSLGKQELNEFARDPFWVRLRWTLFVLFWLAWLLMLVLSVVIIVRAPKCPPPPPKDWWQVRPVYQVQVESFKDGDGDGKGDLRGLHSKLDYLSDDLGVGSIWLNPIYPFPEEADRFGLTNYVEVDSSVGTLEDFQSMVDSAHARDIKVILDFVPNHTSDQHEWFVKSAKKEEPYKDFYLWRAGKKGTPPTNWKSVSGDSAWQWNEERGEYFYHALSQFQPDLNLRNPQVQEELKNALEFWLDKGVDGFAIDSVDYLVEDEDFSDEATTYDNTLYQPGNLEVLKEFRKVLDQASQDKEDPRPRVLISKTSLPADRLSSLYGNVNGTGEDQPETTGDLVQMPINVALLEALEKEEKSAEKVKEVLTTYTEALPKGAWPNFYLGGPQQSRLASRFGTSRLDALTMAMMILPGTPIGYYGDEIGMVDGQVDKGKDKSRSPMQWDDSDNAGFTSGQPWLPVNPDYSEVNVAHQRGAPRSHLRTWQLLARMRHHKVILFGSTDYLVCGDQGQVLVISRVRKGHPGYLFAVNLGDAKQTVDVKKMPFVPSKGTIHAKSWPSGAGGNGTEDSSSVVYFDQVKLKPDEGIIVTFVPDMEKK